MCAFDPVAFEKTVHSELAYILVNGSAEKVVEHAETQRPTHGVDALDAQFRDSGAHDGKTAREHRRALRL